jgi:hypothetical protein
MARANATCKAAIMKKENRESGLVTRIQKLGGNSTKETQQGEKFGFAAEEGKRVQVLLLVSQKWTSIKSTLARVETSRKTWR